MSWAPIRALSERVQLFKLPCQIKNLQLHWVLAGLVERLAWGVLPIEILDHNLGIEHLVIGLELNV
ncbi:hypothetical protein [Glutamicibacter uratoxydans]|uniref:hypothetical protein n=1 Tax=Glutamicibacter uratoxydans TaxID=43667 RepID=UPI0011430BB5|nr:hypothetical protein [Glutamicibacter uratoxydans]